MRKTLAASLVSLCCFLSGCGLGQDVANSVGQIIASGMEQAATGLVSCVVSADFSVLAGLQARLNVNIEQADLDIVFQTIKNQNLNQGSLIWANIPADIADRITQSLVSSYTQFIKDNPSLQWSLDNYKNLLAQDLFEASSEKQTYGQYNMIASAKVNNTVSYYLMQVNVQHPRDSSADPVTQEFCE